MTTADTKNSTTSHYDWHPSASIEENYVLEAIADDGAIIHFYTWAQDWDKVEKYVPRSEWPSVIYAGKKSPKHRSPDPAVNDLIQQVETEVFIDLLQ